MKKVQIEIITILLLIVLIVAGGYYFEPFVFDLSSKRTNIKTKKTLPKEELSFQERIEKLDTSQKIVDYLNEYYTFEERESNEAYTPQEFFNKKRGSSQDFAVFSAHALYEHDFITFVIEYEYSSSEFEGVRSNFVTQVRAADKPKYIYYDKEGAHLSDYGWSFEELCRKEEERMGIEIKKYRSFAPVNSEIDSVQWKIRNN